MKFLSVTSGIEAASVAWEPLGWQAVGYSEIERFPCAVLKHHYPSTPNFGDLTQFKSWSLPNEPVDLIVGGTPCQSFSIAGKRAGLDDPRGQLMLSYIKLLGAFRPRFFVWENVPGVLPSNGGRDFGTFLGAVAKLGYGFAYRVLDAQYIRVESHARAVPQRRRRVFVVGYLGDWRGAAAILFEPESVQGHPAPRRKAQEVVADTLEASTGGIIGKAGRHLTLVSNPHTDVCPAIKARDSKGPSSDGDGDGAVLVPMMYRVAGDGAAYHDRNVVSPLTTGTDSSANVLVSALAISGRARGDDRRGYARPEHISDVAGSLDTAKPDRVLVPGMAIRRLLPLECERLQGFPDGYTDIPKGSDTARYKALGNSMAVNVMRWIGNRIALFDEIKKGGGRCPH
jgi:DNA (cytosine-5)-methyltransferase 1